MPPKRLKRTIQDCHEDKANLLKGDMVIAKSIEKFNNDLYKIVTCYEEGNFAMSGLSVYLALSMCSLGAKENTANEMLNALNLEKSSQLTNIKDIISHFLENEVITVGIVNKIFTDESIVLKKTFKNAVQNTFHSDVESVSFLSDVQKTVSDINYWCSKHTNEKIKDIITADDITDDTRLIVLNAVYFKAFWKELFQACNTMFEPFHVSKKKIINVATMKQCESWRYKDITELYAECIAKPYRDPNFVFLIIKPKEIDGLRYLEQNLDKIDLDYGTFGKYEVISLSLPKFRIETTLDLDEYLEKMNMVEMFSEQANFKGISEKPVLIPPLHVDKVLQKVFIQVDEAGTEAAAVTRLISTGGGMPIQFKLDRPFLYRIVNIKYNLTLFSGRVVVPE